MDRLDEQLLRLRRTIAQSAIPELDDAQEEAMRIGNPRQAYRRIRAIQKTRSSLLKEPDRLPARPDLEADTLRSMPQPGEPVGGLKLPAKPIPEPPAPPFLPRGVTQRPVPRSHPREKETRQGPPRVRLLVLLLILLIELLVLFNPFGVWE